MDEWLALPEKDERTLSEYAADESKPPPITRREASVVLAHIERGIHVTCSCACPDVQWEYDYRIDSVKRASALVEKDSRRGHGPFTFTSPSSVKETANRMNGAWRWAAIFSLAAAAVAGVALEAGDRRNQATREAAVIQAKAQVLSAMVVSGFRPSVEDVEKMLGPQIATTR